MRKYFYLLIISLAGIAFNSCKKDIVEIPFDDAFNKPYSTGIIKIQYQNSATINGIAIRKDTIVSFTSIGNNPSEKDLYGYSKPSSLWAQLHRLNPDNFHNRAFIFFPGTNLDLLTLPHTFKPADVQNAQINYVIDLRPFFDPNGNVVYGTNTYAATTYSNNFELTIL